MLRNRALAYNRLRERLQGPANGFQGKQANLIYRKVFDLWKCFFTFHIFYKGYDES